MSITAKQLEDWEEEVSHWKTEATNYSRAMVQEEREKNAALQELAALRARQAVLVEALTLLLSDIEQGADPLDAECRRITGSYDKARAALAQGEG